MPDQSEGIPFTLFIIRKSSNKPATPGALQRHLLVREKDPAFRGSAIDVLNLGEKFGWISDAALWRRIRELRNMAAHEYEAEDYRGLYKELIRLTPALLKFSFP